MAEQHVIKAFEQLFRFYAGCQLEDHAAGLQSEEAVGIVERFDEFKAKLVAQAHGGYQCSYATLFDCGSSSDFACFHSLMYSGQVFLQGCKVQYFGTVARAGQEDYLVACCLEVGRYSLVAVDYAYCEGNECRRNGFIHEGTAHAVLAADCRQVQSIKCGESAQQCAERLAPAVGIMQLRKVLLQSQAQLSGVCTQCYRANYRFCYSVHCAVERAPAGNVRVVAAGHYAGCGGVAVQHRNAPYHALARGELGFAAERHHYGAAADGAVKALGQALFAADIQTAEVSQPCSFKVSSGGYFGRNLLEYVVLFFFAYYDIGVLCNAVGIEESA